MQGFTDRRPVTPVPKVELRSKEALVAHLSTHHGGAADLGHADLRALHADNHSNEYAITPVPHDHGRQG